MNSTKTSILEKAFVLFLEKGYAATSISDIQQSVGVGRATLYHHFQNKEELLMKVIQHYVVDVSQTVNAEVTNATVADRIEIRLERLKAITNRITNGNNNISLLNYLSLVHSAAELDGELIPVFQQQLEKERKFWIRALQQGKEANEVRSDIHVDQTAELFMAVQDSAFMLSGFFSDTIDMMSRTRRMYYQLYDLIKS